MGAIHRTVFENPPIADSLNYYEKMNYKYFKDVTTMIPKCSFTKEVKEHFNNSSTPYTLDGEVFETPLIITKEIFDLNHVTYQGKKKFQKDYLKVTDDHDGYRQAVRTWIHFCMTFLRSYKSTQVYDLSSIQPNNFDRVDLFYSEVNKLLYNITFSRIPCSYIDNLVESGQIYLFKIWNKDFSEKSKGTPNMHTLYWRNLFAQANLNDVVYKLNGEAEIFFREASIPQENRIIHTAQHNIDNKNSLNPKKQSLFDYDIIKDRRYTMDTFQFHVPITLNLKAQGIESINDTVNNLIRKHRIKHIIGIDRGERHLLYLSMIDLKGNIVKQMSLNEILVEYKGIAHRTNYQQLLAEREHLRQEQRQSWEDIDKIKDLKEGYLSQAIHVITQMMIENDAILVLENLNSGFMRGRQKIERQVYEKFVKMLIDKLSYVVDKQADADVPTGVRHALQLVNSPTTKSGHQNGCIFYIPAWNTSKIDPVTGFVNLFDTRRITKDKIRSFFDKFDSIRYNAATDWFEFETDYSKFTSKAELSRKKWTLCSHGKRIRTFRNPAKNNQWDNEEIDLTTKMKELFVMYSIDIHGNLKQAIAEQQTKEFYTNLLLLFKLMIQMRNSITNTDIDYMISPVADEHGHFYNSDEKIASLPDNADANGAYNIARKGLWTLQQIEKSSKSEKDNKLKLSITNQEYLRYVQNREYLNE